MYMLSVDYKKCVCRASDVLDLWIYRQGVPQLIHYIKGLLC